MMNLFKFAKRSTKIFGHHQSVLEDVPGAALCGLVSGHANELMRRRKPDVHVAHAIKSSSALPPGILWAMSDHDLERLGLAHPFLMPSEKDVRSIGHLFLGYLSGMADDAGMLDGTEGMTTNTGENPFDLLTEDDLMQLEAAALDAVARGD